ncbi:HPr kinase/phosphorylase [Methylobacterium marchantiae]|uniref:HPr kinase/phosphorylase n=1 Tax=Methylobacterium marchantiae TaxID=600331 RepID=A0ABW3X0Z5_9HYPH|nr:HPr kinase/phosphorylase [Methylobacterium marchantiae]
MDRSRSEPALTIHATCIVYREAGILIRGEAGAGKSSLALSLLDRARQDGSYAALVGDDRIGIQHCHGRVVARCHRALHGLIEIRGLGLVPQSSLADAAIVRIVVDLVETLPRLPNASPDTTDLLGKTIRRIMLDRSIRDSGLAPGIILDILFGRGSVAPRTHLGAVSCDPASRV